MQLRGPHAGILQRRKVQLCLFRQMLVFFGFSLYALTSEWNIDDMSNLI